VVEAQQAAQAEQATKTAGSQPTVTPPPPPPPPPPDFTAQAKKVRANVQQRLVNFMAGTSEFYRDDPQVSASFNKMMRWLGSDNSLTTIEAQVKDVGAANADKRTVRFIRDQIFGLPEFRQGGVIDGPPGSEQVVMGHGGEGILSRRGMQVLGALNNADLSRLRGDGGMIGGVDQTNIFYMVIHTEDVDSFKRLVDGQLGDYMMQRVFRDSKNRKDVVHTDGIYTPPSE
jgi:hypothetical protein